MLLFARSTKPFVWGWCDVDMARLIPRLRIMLCQMSLVNRTSRSDTTFRGSPCTWTMFCRKSCAASSAVMFFVHGKRRIRRVSLSTTTIKVVVTRHCISGKFQEVHSHEGPWQTGVVQGVEQSVGLVGPLLGSLACGATLAI